MVVDNFDHQQEPVYVSLQNEIRPLSAAALGAVHDGWSYWIGYTGYTFYYDIPYVR